MRHGFTHAHVFNIIEIVHFCSRMYAQFDMCTEHLKIETKMYSFNYETIITLTVLYVPIEFNVQLLKEIQIKQSSFGVHQCQCRQDK